MTLAATLVFAGSTSLAAQTLIRCPDWQSLVKPVTLRPASEPAAPGAFEAKTRTQNTAQRLFDHSVPGGGRRRFTPAVACTYTIQPGDTYGSIAARHLGSSKRWPDLARINPGVDPKALRIGNRLNLPCDGPAGQGAAVPATEPGPSGAPLSGTGFLASLFGTGRATPEAATAPKSGTAKKPDAKVAAPSATGKTTGSSTLGATESSAGKKQAVSTPGAGKASGKADKPATASAVAAKPAAPPPPPLPVWTAKKGEYLSDVLKRWGKTAGYTVIVDTSDAWELGVPIRLRANFEAAVDELLTGLGHDGTPPRVRLYPNGVLRLGGPL